MSAKRVFFGVFQKIMVICCAMFFGFANAFSANLPSGYTELEYIESSGTQYIDTGIKQQDGDEFGLIYQQVTLDTSYRNLFGASSAGKDRTFYISQTSGTSWVGNINISTIPHNTNKHTLSWVTTSSSGQNIVVDGQTYVVSVLITPNPNLNVMVFARNASQGKMIGKVYGYYQKRNGEYLINLVPAKNASGVIGMYDTVNNVFYQNAGTGTFTAGPEVLNPCRNLFDKDAMIHGAYIGASGTETYSAQYCYSNYIPVTPGQTYTFSAVRNQSASNKRIHAYDSNKNWIQQLGLSPSSSSVGPYDITVTIPSGISYILISGMRCDVDVADTNMQFEQGSTATAYVPYNASCHNTNGIKIATTAYNTARFSPVVNDLNSTVATIREIVTNTINQTAAIASLQADKQTRPEDACPAGKKCLLVETEENGVIVPHWFPIIETPEE